MHMIVVSGHLRAEGDGSRNPVRIGASAGCKGFCRLAGGFLINGEQRADQQGIGRGMVRLGRVVSLQRKAAGVKRLAQKLQKRAAQVGFDWPEALPVVDKLREELDEVLEAMADGDAEAQAEEIGDLLFVVVNLARHLKVDPETALRAANGKFERRFRYIETTLRDQGRKAEECSLEELDALWGEAKREEKNPLGCG